MRNYTQRPYRMLLVGVVTWCGLILLGPVLAVLHLPGVSTCYRIFSHICHQDPERSFFIFGKQFTVCIRCTAIYFTFAAGVLLAPVISKKLKISHRILWIFASLPMLVDVFLDIAGLHSSDTVLRLVTGGIFGIIAALILTPLIIEASTELLSPLQEQRNSHEPET